TPGCRSPSSVRRLHTPPSLSPPKATYHQAFSIRVVSVWGKNPHTGSFTPLKSPFLSPPKAAYHQAFSNRVVTGYIKLAKVSFKNVNCPWNGKDWEPLGYANITSCHQQFEKSRQMRILKTFSRTLKYMVKNRISELCPYKKPFLSNDTRKVDSIIPHDEAEAILTASVKRFTGPFEKECKLTFYHLAD
ncbi:hypothetical protein C0J52_27019, partial [Blattella germanica]